MCAISEFCIQLLDVVSLGEHCKAMAGKREFFVKFTFIEINVCVCVCVLSAHCRAHTRQRTKLREKL